VSNSQRLFRVSSGPTFDTIMGALSSYPSLEIRFGVEGDDGHHEIMMYVRSFAWKRRRHDPEPVRVRGDQPTILEGEVRFIDLHWHGWGRLEYEVDMHIGTLTYDLDKRF